MTTLLEKPFTDCKYLHSIVDYRYIFILSNIANSNRLYSECNLFFHLEFPLGLYCEYAHLKYVDENEKLLVFSCLLSETDFVTKFHV